MEYLDNMHMNQTIFEGNESYLYIDDIIKESSCSKILIVCGGTFKRSVLPEFLQEKKIDYCIYDGFQPNPTYENVLEGLKIFKENQCDFLISIGGGSAIDVAKCIKAYAKIDETKDIIRQKITDSHIRHLAMPTTAGTGSESTHFAVIYENGCKMSVSHNSLLPEYVILEPMLLATLPDYQKKSTLLDALCQATESYWSVNATVESRKYAAEAIRIILKYAKPYIDANSSLIKIFHGANLAGRAINITQTTLAHAMSYKLTSLYGCSHGHAVALCLPYAWEYLEQYKTQLPCGREKDEIAQTLEKLYKLYHCDSTNSAISFFRGMFVEFGLSVPKCTPEDLELLASSVNQDRMKNFPAPINKEQCLEMYRHILTDQDKLIKQYGLQFTVACGMRKIETLSEAKRYKFLQYDIQEMPLSKRTEAAENFIESLLVYENSREEASRELEKAIFELCISLGGYALGNEVDTINYKNARNILFKYKKEADETARTNAKALAKQYRIDFLHGLLLYRFEELTKLWQDQISRTFDLFGVRDKGILISILQGMLCQFGLLVKNYSNCEALNVPSDYQKEHCLILYWQTVQSNIYNKKFNHYLKELRKAQLSMMDEIARVCDKYHLTYVLNYGSLLGAIRHKGFIPWDDDLDICMPRDDYEKFLEIGRKELKNGCYIYNNQDFHDCWFSMIKVMKKDTVFVRHPYRFGEEDGQRVFIDVWPLDNVPGPEEEAVRRMKKKKSILTRLLRLKIKARTGGELTTIQKFRAILLKPVSEKKLIRMREKAVTKWRNQDTDYWISGGVYNYIKETMPKSWYIPTVTLPYEGHAYKFPGNYQEVLKHFYGNYMQIPPVDKQYTHAPFKVQISAEGEVMYFNETRHRGRKSLKTKFKRKIKIQKKKISLILHPLFQFMYAIGVKITTPVRRLSKNGRLLSSYKDKYLGQTCYVIADSSRLTGEEQMEAKQGITFLGDYGYNLLADKKWQPDFYGINYKKNADHIPDSVASSEKTQIFYTAFVKKGQKNYLNRGIRIACPYSKTLPQKVGQLEKGYRNNGARNEIFLLELAIYMGFSKIILMGFDEPFGICHIPLHFRNQASDKTNSVYESYQITQERLKDVIKKTEGKIEIITSKHEF